MSSAEPRGVRYEVYGRVQGVGFRAWVSRNAERLGLSGEVRNRPDGSVEVRARGEAAALGEFGELLRRGAPASRVERVEESEDRSVGGEGFRIVR